MLYLSCTIIQTLETKNTSGMERVKKLGTPFRKLLFHWGNWVAPFFNKMKVLPIPIRETGYSFGNQVPISEFNNLTTW